jgi:hypothetical protein
LVEISRNIFQISNSSGIFFSTLYHPLLLQEQPTNLHNVLSIGWVCFLVPSN